MSAITFTGLSSAGGRVSSVLSALLFEKIHDPTDLRAVMTEVPWSQIGSDTMSIALDGAPGAFDAATSETSSAMAPPARRERAEISVGRKPRSVPRYCTAMRRCLVMRDGVTGRGPIEVKLWTRGLREGLHWP